MLRIPEMLRTPEKSRADVTGATAAQLSALSMNGTIVGHSLKAHASGPTPLPCPMLAFLHATIVSECYLLLRRPITNTVTSPTRSNEPSTVPAKSWSLLISQADNTSPRIAINAPTHSPDHDRREANA